MTNKLHVLFTLSLLSFTACVDTDTDLATSTDDAELTITDDDLAIDDLVTIAPAPEAGAQAAEAACASYSNNYKRVYNRCGYSILVRVDLQFLPDQNQCVRAGTSKYVGATARGVTFLGRGC